MKENKPEIIDVTETSAASVIVMEAMLDPNVLGGFAPGVRKRLKQKKDRQMWEVQLTVDGIQVPVAKTLNAVWERENKRIEERALARAKEMISEVGLSGIQDALRDAEWKIQNALDERFGKDT